MENLLAAWGEFVLGKRKKRDVQEFQHRLMDNIFTLHQDLKNGTYKHDTYHAFKISDPKPRDIHKATVRDRLIHHAIYRILYPSFDRTWISDSFSCRERKGTHRAMDRLRFFARKVSRNHTRTCWVLKCDIRKFFASIDQGILLAVIRKRVHDERVVALIAKVVGSFHSTGLGKGLPLGNLTSQMLVNAYMNEFDQWIKHSLKARYYVRYADDFIILSDDKYFVEDALPRIHEFLQSCLRLKLHPDKMSMRTFASGIDFLGWVHFPDHRIIRTSTKRRMLQHLENNPSDATKTAYRGMLAHGNAYTLMGRIR